MDFKSLNEIVTRILQWIRGIVRVGNQYTNTELTYRKRVVQLLYYYRGEQLEFLSDVINKQFVEPSRLKLQLAFSNVVRYITDTLCMTFKNGVIVKAENEAEQDVYDQIVEDIQLDSFLKTLEKYVFLAKTVFVKVSHRDNRLALDLITPEYVEIETASENPQRLTSILYPVKIDKINQFAPSGVFAHWTDGDFTLVDENGNEQKNEENPDNVNPYSLIPVVAFRETMPVTSEFMQYPSEELITAQDNLNVKLTELNYLIKLQSFSIPVFKNPGKMFDGQVNVTIDPTKPIVIESNKDEPGDFSFVTPSPKIEDVQKSVDKEYLRIFSFYGINPSQFVSSAERQSADSIREGNSKVDEYRENMKLVYVPLIRNLFDVIREVWNAHETQQLSDAGVAIAIPDSRVGYQSITEKWNDYKNKLELNLITPAEIMVNEEDDLTIEQAIEKILENKQIAKQLETVEQVEQEGVDNSQE